MALGYFTPITDARPAASTELRSRQIRYTVTMAFRTACFIAMIFVPGVFRWILFVCAVFLPYVAVIFANQANERKPSESVGGGGPGDARAITTGADSAEVISGSATDMSAGASDSGAAAGPADESKDDRPSANHRSDGRPAGPSGADPIV